MIEIATPPNAIAEMAWQVLPIAERALQFAIQELEVYETAESPKGSDRGPRVDVMLRQAQSSPNNPWGAAFVTFCLQNAGWNPVATEGRGVMYPASIPSWITWATKIGRNSGKLPIRGDLAYIDRPGDGRIGFVEGVRNGCVEVIGGDCHDALGGRVARSRIRTCELHGTISLEGLIARA